MDETVSPSAGTKRGTTLRDVLGMDDDAVGVSAYVLAGMGVCASPDRPGSPGAVFLEDVALDTIDRADEIDGERFDHADLAHEIADAAVPIYTHTIWSTFVDLAAYNEDPTELGVDGSDMLQAAKVCLYMIAERVAMAVLDEIERAEDEGVDA